MTEFSVPPQLLRSLRFAGIERLYAPRVKAWLDQQRAMGLSSVAEGNSKDPLAEPGESSLASRGARIATRKPLPSLPSLPSRSTGPIPLTPTPRLTQTSEPAMGRTKPTILKTSSDRGTVTDPVAALAVIEREVQDCRRCDVLAKGRTRTVFGVGNPRPRLCFVGEAPGADEDQQGIPFVGRAGQLLTKIIEACTLTRDDVYILNTLKCRPPNNRNPEPEELDNCRGFFERQMEILRPEYICCLGLVAATAVLQRKATLGSLRGSLHPWQGAQVLVTYHPAYLLRNPDAKRLVWDDMRFLMKEMGIALPS